MITDISSIVAEYFLTGKPIIGVGPQDVALAIIGEVFGNEKLSRHARVLDVSSFPSFYYGTLLW